MNRQSIGEGLAARLYAAEIAVDRALSETAALVAALPAAWAEARLSAVAGRKAFDEAAASVAALAHARSHLVDVHRALSALARSLGLDALAVGVLDKPGDRPPIGGGGGDSPPQPPVNLNKSLTNTANKVLPADALLC
jgi:hypothetical protein